MVYFTAQPGWEEHVSDMDKKVLSKVLPLLEGKALRGGLPVNPIMFAYFLPFLSGYPDHSEDFYRQFFSSFASGINSVLSQERPKSVAGLATNSIFLCLLLVKKSIKLPLGQINDTLPSKALSLLLCLRHCR